MLNHQSLRPLERIKDATRIKIHNNTNASCNNHVIQKRLWDKTKFDLLIL